MYGANRVYVGRARVGRGLFASLPYKANRRIVRLHGRIVSADAVWHHQGRFADNSYRFGPETYLDPGDEAGAWVNHSCDPSAAVRKSRSRLYLHAARTIERGAEITIDYSTILGDDDIWTMHCRCGSRRCRKTIGSFGALPAELQERYVGRGMVPRFILATLE